MKVPENFNPDASPSSAETILQHMGEDLSNFSPPSEAHCAQLYRALAEEHQRALDLKQRQMDDALRNVMMNVHLILSIGRPDPHLSNPSASGSPQTIRALIHRPEEQAK